MAFKSIFPTTKNNDKTWSMAHGNAKDADEPVLVLLSVPTSLDESGIRNMCSPYGKIERISFAVYPNHLIYFVEFSNTSEKELAMREINSTNQLGIRAMPKKPKASSSVESDIPPSKSSSKNNINFSNRNLVAPLSDPTQEYTHEVPRNIIVTQDDYENSALKTVDPNRDFLNNPEQMRNALKSNRGNPRNSAEHVYKPKENAKKSPSHYNEQKNTFECQSSETFTKPIKVGNCLNCTQFAHYMCSRCKCFYCSKKCQEENWPLHKQVCNEMPKLIEFSDLNAQPQLPNHGRSHNNKSQENRNQGSNENRNFNRNGNRNINRNEHRIESPNSGNNRNFDKKNDSKYSPKKVIEITPESISDPIKSLSIKDTGAVHTGSTIKMQMENFTNNIRKPPVAIPILMSPFPKTKGHVAITAVIAPNIIYIRPIDEKSNEEYCKNIQLIYNCSIDAEQLTELPKKGDIVLAEFQDQGYYRSLVLNVDAQKDEVVVSYIDFGNSDIKTLDELKHLKTEFKGLTRFSLKATLKGIDSHGNTEAALNYLNDLCDDVRDLEIRYDDEYSKDTKIELIEHESNNSVNRMVNQKLKIKPPRENEPIIMMEDIPKSLLEDGKNVKLQIIDNSGLINGILTCAYPDAIYEDHFLTVKITKYCESLDKEAYYTPRLNEACLFKSGSKWYRGGCVDLAGDGKPTLLYLDIGKYSLTSIDLIRKMPKEFSTQKLCGVPCVLDGVPDDLNAQQLKVLKGKLPENEVITVDEINTVNLAEDEDEEKNLVNTILFKKLEGLFT